MVAKKESEGGETKSRNAPNSNNGDLKQQVSQMQNFAVLCCVVLRRCLQLKRVNLDWIWRNTKRIQYTTPREHTKQDSPPQHTHTSCFILSFSSDSSATRAWKLNRRNQNGYMHTWARATFLKTNVPSIPLFSFPKRTCRKPKYFAERIKMV